VLSVISYTAAAEPWHGKRIVSLLFVTGAGE
jgi:hypothetical protein